MLTNAGLSATTLEDRGIEYDSREEDIECFATFEENALAKARYFYRIARMPVLADDSGLSVNALNGAPGVWSKRYSGRDDIGGQDLDDANNEKLLRELAGFRDMSASYTCAAAFVDGEVEAVESGQTFGRMVNASSGEKGFGYDPYFFSTELGKTFGDATIEEKEKVSHRGRAFRALLDALREQRGT